MSAAGHVLLPRELAPTCSISERNVVVRGGRGSPCEVAGVGRNVGLRRETATVLGALAGPQELDGIGNDIHCLALVPFLVLPLAPLEPTVERDRAPLRQVVRAVLALGAPHCDVEEVRLLDPVARGVLAARVGGDPQAAHRRAARRGAQLGVAREVAGENYPVDVGASHRGGPPSIADEDCPARVQRVAGAKTAWGREEAGK